MKVYASLIVFCGKSKPLLLVDNTLNIPKWLIRDDDRPSLDVVRDGLYNISGVDPCFFPEFIQSCVYEDFSEREKIIHIIYNVYFPSPFEISSVAYRWTGPESIKGTPLQNLIIYVYGKRYV